MKRLSFLLLLCACVNLEKPRAYRCESSTDCIEPWVCLRDSYCHDPDLGVDVACESAADCAGGWYCGKDGRCRDPEKPSALVCDDDTQCANGWFCSQEGVCRDRSVGAALPCEVDAQCAGGWRCNTERTCVDVSLEPSVPVSAQMSSSRQLSPLIPMASVLHPTPGYSADFQGSPVLVQQSVLQLPDGGALLSGVFLGLTDELVSVRQTLTPFSWLRPLVDIEVSGGFTMLLDDARQVWVLDGLGAKPFDADGEVLDIKPLQLPAPGGATEAAFVLIRVQKPALVFHPATDERYEVGKGPVIDLAHLEGRGMSARFVVVNALAGSDSVVEEYRRSDSSTVRLFALQQNDGGVVLAVRTRGLTVAMKLELSDGSNPLLASYAAQLLDLSGPSLPRHGAPLQCPQGRFEEFAISSRGWLDVACLGGGDDGYVWRREGLPAPPSPLREFRAAQVAGTSGVMLRQSRAGVLQFGDDLENDLGNVLDGPPDRLGVYGGVMLAAVRGSALYLSGQEAEATDVPQGLSLVQFTVDAGSTHVGTFIEGSDAWLWSNGLAIRATFDGGAESFPWVFEGLPRLSRPVARVVPASSGSIFVASDLDTLWAAPMGDAGVSAVVRPTAKLAPGFPVTSWIAGPSDAGLVEGWATANNRVFKLSASSVERWKVTEVPVSGREPLAVFFHAGAPRLGTTTGEVLSLPSRV
ncbi:MAG: hypothetical protein ACO1OB_28505, partial [Archangium sp.]